MRNLQQEINILYSLRLRSGTQFRGTSCDHVFWFAELYKIVVADCSIVHYNKTNITNDNVNFNNKFGFCDDK